MSDERNIKEKNRDEEDIANIGGEILDKYENLLNSTINTKNSYMKNKLMRQTHNYLLTHSYIIQKYMEKLDIRDKIKIITKLKRFKEDEIQSREQGEKDYIKMIFMSVLIFMLIFAIIGLINKDELIVIYSVIGGVIVSLILVSAADYMYDISSTKREVKNIDNWLMELKEEEHVIKEYNVLKQELQDSNFGIAEYRNENKELKKKNKELEEEVEELKQTLSSYIK